MEKVAITEKVIPKQDVEEEIKKIEFNVNAKEFVPIFAHDSPDGSEQWNSEQQNCSQKPVINKRIGENYKPVFMDGMTEKFIQGPYVGNGKDPEIPFVRYFSKGQAIDFYNKKYFSPDASGEITFRPGEGNEPSHEECPPQKSFFDSAYVQSNIFRPPFIDMLVQDILHRQYRSMPAVTAVGGRRGGKSCLQHPRPQRGTSTESKDKSTQLEPVDTEDVWLEEEPKEDCKGNASKDSTIGCETPQDEIVNSDSMDVGSVNVPRADPPKEQRPTKTRDKIIISKPLELVPEEVKTLNGLIKSEDKDMSSILKNNDSEPVKINIDKLEESPDVKILPELADTITSVEPVSIAVNISIEPAKKEYAMREEKKMTEPVVDSNTDE